MCSICQMLGRTAAETASAHASGVVLPADFGIQGDAAGATPGVSVGAPVGVSGGVTALADATAAASAIPAVKPVWSLDQIVSNLERYNEKWAPGVTVTYSFELTRPAGMPASVGFAPLTEEEKSFVRAAYALIGDLIGVKFVEVADDGTYGSHSSHISYALNTNASQYEWGDTQTWTHGSAGGGDSAITSAQVYLNPTAVNQRSWIFGGYNFMSTIHETLHALGFPHPGDYNADGSTITYANSAEYAQDSRQYTVMSYFDETNTGANFLPTGESASYSPSTPQIDDVAALQAIYGANTATRTGDTTYGYNSTAGEPSYDFAANPHFIGTIYDAGGNDTIDLSGSAFAAKLDLVQGAFSNVQGMSGNLTIAYGTVIENAIGTPFNDGIFGNEVANHLQGGAGDDTLAGRGGNDTLDGGAGTDTDSFIEASTGFTWWQNADGTWTVQGDGANAAAEGTDTLISVEQLQFSDAVIKLTGLSPTEQVNEAFANILRYAPATAADTGYAAALASQLTSGALSSAGVDASLAVRAEGTTSVATLAYEFFTGAEPTKAGLDYLVSPTGGNANNLNSAYYQGFSIENRYINFAVNLGKAGEGAARFASTYGGLTLFDATKAAYGAIFGTTPSDAKVHAILDPVLTFNGVTETRAQYFADYGGDGLTGIGTKAAMVGWLLSEAVKADAGTYALSNDAFLADLADGAQLHVDLIGTYGQGSFAVSAATAGF